MREMAKAAQPQELKGAFDKHKKGRRRACRKGSKGSSFRQIVTGLASGPFGHAKLALGPLAHRLDHGDPRDGHCDDGFRGCEGACSTGNPRRRHLEPSRGPDFRERGYGADIGCSARNGVSDLGSSLLMAWRSRLTWRRIT
jgi:hypothetical protein